MVNDTPPEITGCSMEVQDKIRRLHDSLCTSQVPSIVCFGSPLGAVNKLENAPCDDPILSHEKLVQKWVYIISPSQASPSEEFFKKNGEGAHGCSKKISLTEWQGILG